MRDPCIIKGPDGLFHMVWTSSWNEKGIGYANTADLIHWSDQKYLQVMKDEVGARNCWAPEIFYDAASKWYMIFWATTIEGKFSETASKKESGYNHRIYFVTTFDFLNFTEPEILYNQDFNVIDATLIREKNHYVMFLKDETVEPPQKNIRIATSGHLTKGFSKPTEPITGNYWAEGPTVAKLPEGWIVYFDRYREKRMGAVISTDLKTWKDISDKVQFPAGVRHGTVFSVSKEIFEKLH
jgi:beta-xylosidase